MSNPLVKKYFIKVYQPNGTFITTVRDINFTSFHKQINTGLGQLDLTMARKFDNFDENYVIKFNNRIDMWVVDQNTGSNGKKIYSGYISSYLPKVSGDAHTVSVRCYGYVSKLTRTILKHGSVIELGTDATNGLIDAPSGASSATINKVLTAVIDRFQAETTNPVVNYSATSIQSTTNTLLYHFSLQTFIDAINKAKEFAPSDYYWYIGQDNIFQFKQKATSATHTFIFGRHFNEVQVEKNMDSVVNNVIFSSGDGGDATILKLYSDATSITNYDDCWEVVTDNRVSDITTADNDGASVLAAKKTAVARTSVVILDDNEGATINGIKMGYDIESIEPGDTCKFRGFNPITSQTFNDNMQIVAVDYYRDRVVLTLEDLNPLIARIAVENKKAIDEVVNTTNATTLSNSIQITSGPGMIPTGGMVDWPTDTAPDGWVLCQGQSLLMVDYPALYGVIGTVYGSVDGTHFTLPDKRGRVSVGKSSDTEFNALGKTGGDKSLQVHTHTGTTGYISADHSHSGNTGYMNTNTSHTHDTHIDQGGLTHTGVYIATGSASDTRGNATSSTDINHIHAFTTGGVSSNHTHDFTTASTGSGSGQNLQPYITFNTIIKL